MTETKETRKDPNLFLEMVRVEKELGLKTGIAHGTYHIWTGQNTDDWDVDWDNACVIYDRMVEEFGWARLYIEITTYSGDTLYENCLIGGDDDGNI